MIGTIAATVMVCSQIQRNLASSVLLFKQFSSYCYRYVLYILGIGVPKHGLRPEMLFNTVVILPVVIRLTVSI